MSGGTQLDPEALRCREIYSLDLHQLRHPQVFQTIVELVRSQLDCPIALLSIVDSDRQWFLAKSGLSVDQTSLDTSFCRACLARGTEALLVTDTTTQPPFSEMELVQGPPFIRSYLGVQVRSPSGIPIGTICAIHLEKNAFAERHVDVLTKLALLAEHAVLSHANTRELEAQNTVFKQAERSASIGSWMLDLASYKLLWSEETYRIHGMAPSENIEVHEAINLYVAEDREKVQAALSRAIGADGSFEFEASLVAVNGETKRIFARGERIDRNGRPERLVGICQDITQHYIHVAALERAANIDPLTELPNRSAFDRELHVRARSSTDDELVIGVIDLDGFKDVNDEYGHLVGDMVLQEMASRLRDTLPPEAFVARWGGDEFAILMSCENGMQRPIATANELIAAINRPLNLPSVQLKLGATVGLAPHRHGTQPQETLRQADLAMYSGKHRRSGGVHVYSKTIERAHTHRLDAIRSVQTAIDKGRVFAVYQPIIDLYTYEVDGFEALLRFSDDHGHIVTAEQIAPAFLDPSICKRIGECIQAVVAADAPSLIRGPGKPRIAVNVSEAELTDPDFAASFIARYRASGLFLDNLTVELTETMLLTDADAVRDTLVTLVEHGVQVSLDDFGTGFSSLSHLRDFPIHKVKLDRSFIADIESKHEARLIVQAMIGMAANLRISTIAEGVETFAQRDILRSMGCNYAQGFLFGQGRTAEMATLTGKAAEAARAPR